MRSIFRTIAVVTIAFNAVMFGVGWLFGMTPTQSLGAGVIGFAAIGLVLGWRAVVNAPRPKLRTDWQHLSADHVDRLATPRAVAEIVAPQQRQIEAPRREVEVSRWTKTL